MTIQVVAPSFEDQIERCRREIAEIERLLRAGHPDVEGLCLAVADWCAELRLIEAMARKAEMPAAAGAGRAGGVDAKSIS